MTRTTATLTIAIAVCLALLAGTQARARNVDISTVPPRDWVQLTIYNSDDLTLVREMRSLTLKKGLNRIQYSWAGTLIDPTSLDLQARERQDEIEILDTTFLGDKPQHCIWNIESKFEGQVQFVVTYFTSGIRWSADYVAITNPEESEMSFDGYVQVYNNSGEEYENAEVRLVVGVVNLVEKIRELAQKGILPRPGTAQYKHLEAEAMRRSISVADAKFDKAMTRPPEIIKEGLSEYFIYTVEGRQTVRNGWSKRMLSFRARQVSFNILYRMRAHQCGPRPIRFFMMVNDAEHKMGTTPLPNGLVRVFRDNGRDGLSYLLEQKIPYVPIKEDIELRVGTDDEVVYERTCLDVMRNNWTFDSGHVVGYHEWRDMSERIRNYKDKPIRIEIRHILSGDFELDIPDGVVHDYRTAAVTLVVKAHSKLDWTYKQLQLVGRNARQKNWIQIVPKLKIR